MLQNLRCSLVPKPRHLWDRNCSDGDWRYSVAIMLFMVSAHSCGQRPMLTMGLPCRSLGRTASQQTHKRVSRPTVCCVLGNMHHSLRHVYCCCRAIVFLPLLVKATAQRCKQQIKVKMLTYLRI